MKIDQKTISEAKKLNHLVIIPDGNRRWARERKLPVYEGHRRGYEVAVRLAKASRDLGIHTLTFWAFSTENWQRSRKEVGYLMGLFARMVDRVLKEAKADQVRIVHLGRKDRLSKKLLQKIIKAEEETKNNQRFFLNIALDYGGRDEIIRAVNRIIQKPKSKIQNPKPHPSSLVITEKDIEANLDTVGQTYPEPDLILRTSGEERYSGILMWQGVYAEFYFLKKNFPEMTVDDLKAAVLEYSRRQRRFGK